MRKCHSPGSNGSESRPCWISRPKLVFHSTSRRVLADAAIATDVPSRSDDLRKDDIIEALDAHLRENATRLSNNASFQGYFGARASTPFKSRQSVAPAEATAVSSGDDAVKSVVKARGRKPTKVKQEPEYVSDTV